MDPDRCGQIIKDDALLDRALDFFGIGWHLGGTATVGHGDPGCAKTFGGPGGVNGHISAADHHHAITRFAMNPQIDLP